MNAAKYSACVCCLLPAQRTATLNWPSLAEEQEGDGSQGDGDSSSSPRQQHHTSLPGQF